MQGSIHHSAATSKNLPSYFFMDGDGDPFFHGGSVLWFSFTVLYASKAEGSGPVESGVHEKIFHMTVAGLGAAHRFTVGRARAVPP